MKIANEQRLEILRKKLKKNSHEAFLVFKDENIFYLTGFFAKDSGSILVVTENEAILMVHFIHAANAESSADKEKIEVIRFISEKIKNLSEILEKNKIKTAYIEGNNVSYDLYVSIQKELENKNITVDSRAGFIEEFRIIKSEEEISAIKKSCAITFKAFKAISSIEHEKLASFTEKSLAFEIEKKMIEQGSEGKSFDMIVALNSSSALPHYEPAGKKISGGLLLLDIGCRYKIYCSDLTRTIFMDNRSKEFKKSVKIRKLMDIYDIVLQSQILALKACRAGITCKELDRVARRYIEDKGFGKYFGHGLGHGVGLEIHELPTVSFAEDNVLKDGMVITIEPGIYIEGTGGVRIEDVVVVRDGGCENMYRDTKSMVIV